MRIGGSTASRSRWSRAVSGGTESYSIGLFVPGLQWYWRADNFTELSDEAIARHVEHGSKVPTMLSTMHLYPVNGAPSAWGRTTPHTVFARRCSPR